MSKELPKFAPRQATLQYSFPHVVISVGESNGQRQYTILEGGNRSITFDIEEYFSFEEEKAEPFKVNAYNVFNLAGVTVSALNDAYPEFNLIPSNPTASEYMALRGTRVLRSFSIRQDPSLTAKHEKPVFRVHKSWMKL